MDEKSTGRLLYLLVTDRTNGVTGLVLRVTMHTVVVTWSVRGRGAVKEFPRECKILVFHLTFAKGSLWIAVSYVDSLNP